MNPIYEINSQFAHYVLLDTLVLQILQISFGQIKIISRKQNKELYRICDRQRIQIAVTTLRHQLQSANISHSIQEKMLAKVD